MLKDIKSKFIINKVFSNLNEKTKLYIIKYNKNLQNKVNINITNYNTFSGRYIIYDNKDKKKEKNI